jgi:hypothetical protein
MGPVSNTASQNAVFADSRDAMRCYLIGTTNFRLPSLFDEGGRRAMLRFLLSAAVFGACFAAAGMILRAQH